MNSEIRVLSDPEFLRVEPSIPGSLRVLLLHGYGQDRFELLPLAARLAFAGCSVWVPDLPGHGDNPALFSAAEAQAMVRKAWQISDAQIAIGFSVGARLALGLGAEITVAISPPLDTRFDSETKFELLKHLRPRRVKEAAPMAGLTDALTHIPLLPQSKCLVLLAQKDLSSVLSSVAQWQQAPGTVVKKISHSDHSSILSAPETIRGIFEFLELET